MPTTLVEKEILRERLRFAGGVFILSISLILFVAAVAQGCLYFAGLLFASSGRFDAFPALQQAGRTILVVSLLALAVAAWKGYLAWKNSAWRVGRLLDEKLAASKNRLEASTELGAASDPLARAQRQETSDYLARKPSRQRIHTLALATACCAALLVLNGTVAMKFIVLAQKSQVLAQAKKPAAPEVAARPPYAKIDIVAPESETRATPIEEVVVKGDADSDNGFSAVSLEASINGGPDKSIPIDPARFNKGGEIKFDQSLLLDELGTQPYDIIGYYLKGTSRHATPLKVSSQIQFIEVRPFREDIRKMAGLNGAGASFDKLMGLISRQIIISKRTWIIATSQLPATDPTVASETGKAGDQQDKIAGDTHDLYQDMTANGLPATIVDHVSQAETSMRQAVGKIRQPALLEANPLQQHALGELVAATKSFIKVMVTGGNPKPDETHDPFKNKQKMPPSGAANSNSIAQLHQLIRQEQDIVKNLSSSSSDASAPDNSARQQSRIGKDLGNLQNQPGTPPSSNPAMTEAQQATQSSANKLTAQDETGALNDARSAEAAMLRAQAAMETEAGQHLRDTLAQAQQQLQDAARAQRDAASPSAQAQVKDQAAAARDGLTQEQEHQAASGDPKLADLAHNLVKQYDQSGVPQKLAQLAAQPDTTPEDRAAAADSLRKLADQLSAARLATQSETQNLEDVLRRIERIERNMNAAHGTAEVQAELARELASDLDLALSDANALLPSDGPVIPDFRHMQVPARPLSPLDFRALSGPLAAFQQEVERRLDYLRNQTELSYLDPDQSPEQYRAQVAAYYERISRETKAAAPNPPAATPSP